VTRRKRAGFRPAPIYCFAPRGASVAPPRLESASPKPQWSRNALPRRAVIAALASTVAALSASTAPSNSADEALARAACSNRSAACATRVAPMPLADPESVWAAPAANAGSALAMRSSKMTVWRPVPECHAGEMILVDDGRIGRGIGDAPRSRRARCDHDALP